jgi:crotonobetainyl-CoA:carnitine CoA-transferase CaiB-like acyl-CoA transferase
VNDLADLLKDPHLSAVEMFPTFDHPSEGRMRAVRSPLRVAGIEDLPDVPAPRLGEDTGAILAELRYDAVEISALRACGAVQVAASRPADLAEGGR